MTVANFMLEVKCKWLLSNWEDKLIQELIAPQGECEFYEWSISTYTVLGHEVGHLSPKGMHFDSNGA